jgi:hypothetical protein
MGVISTESGFIHTEADLVSIGDVSALRLHTKLEDNAFKNLRKAFPIDYEVSGVSVVKNPTLHWFSVALAVTAGT